MIVKYIYTGETDIFTLNYNQLLELTNILITTDLELFLKFVFLKLFNDVEGEVILL